MASTIPQYMKAAQYKPGTPLDKQLKINTQTPLPKSAHNLKKDTVLVKVAYASLNPVDYKALESPAGRFLNNIPALDYSGTVVSSNVASLKPGDLVFGMTVVPSFGTLAEYAVAPKDGCARAPDGVSLEDLSTVGVAGITAYGSIVPFVKSGDSILINGASGGVGTFAVQIAKALGCHVTATCSGANIELVKGLGADDVIDYRAGDLVATLKKKGKRFDHIFDAAFYNFDLYWQAHGYLKASGKFVTVAGTPSLSFMKTMVAIYLLPAWLGGGKRPFQFYTAQASVSGYEKIAQWMKEGKVKPVIESVLPLEDAAQGYAKLKSNRTRGKIVVEVSKQ